MSTEPAFISRHQRDERSGLGAITAACGWELTCSAVDKFHGPVVAGRQIAGKELTERSTLLGCLVVLLDLPIRVNADVPMET